MLDTAEVLVLLEGLESATAATAVTPTQPPTLHWPHQQSSVAAYTAQLHNGMREKKKFLDSVPKLVWWGDPNSKDLSWDSGELLGPSIELSRSNPLLPHTPPSRTDGPIVFTQATGIYTLVKKKTSPRALQRNTCQNPIPKYPKRFLP